MRAQEERATFTVGRQLDAAQLRRSQQYLQRRGEAPRLALSQFMACLAQATSEGPDKLCTIRDLASGAGRAEVTYSAKAKIEGYPLRL